MEVEIYLNPIKDELQKRLARLHIKITLKNVCKNS
tara:strand:+ start:131 stop:235 length:105 start_codon:yes stop_codon:yes gene_type:complete